MKGCKMCLRRAALAIAAIPAWVYAFATVQLSTLARGRKRSQKPWNHITAPSTLSLPGCTGERVSLQQLHVRGTALVARPAMKLAIVIVIRKPAPKFKNAGKIKDRRLSSVPANQSYGLHCVEQRRN